MVHAVAPQFGRLFGVTLVPLMLQHRLVNTTMACRADSWPAKSGENRRQAVLLEISQKGSRTHNRIAAQQLAL